MQKGVFSFINQRVQKSIALLLLAQFFLQPLALASEKTKEQCTALLAPKDIPDSKDASEIDLYKLLFHFWPRQEGAVSLFDRADTDSLFRAELNLELENIKFAKKAAKLGREFKYVVQKTIATFASPDISSQATLLYPNIDAFESYKKDFKPKHEQLGQRPLKFNEANLKARSAVQEESGIGYYNADMTNPIDTDILLYKQVGKLTAVKEANEETTGFVKDEKALKAVRAWIFRRIEKVRALQAKNLLLLLQEVASESDRPVYLSAPHGVLDLNALKKSTASLALISDSKLPQVLVHDAPLGMSRLQHAAYALTVKTSDDLNLSNKKTLRVSATSPDDRQYYLIRNSGLGELRIQGALNFTVPIANLYDYANVVVRRQGQRSVMADDMFFGQVALRMDIQAHLIGHIESLKKIGALSSVPLIERALKVNAAGEEELLSLKRYADTKSFFSRAQVSSFLKSTDTVDAIEWYGYFRHPNFWNERDIRASNSKALRLTKTGKSDLSWHRSARDKVSDVYSKQNFYGKTFLWMQVLSLLFFVVPLGHLLGSISNSSSGFADAGGANGWDGRGAISILEEGKATNSGSDGDKEIVGFDFFSSRNLPNYFEIPIARYVEDVGEHDLVPLKPGEHKRENFSIDAIAMSSRTSLKTDSEGRVLLPVPRGYRVAGLNVHLFNRKIGQFQRLPREAVQVFRHRPSETYFAKLSGVGKQQLVEYALYLEPMTQATEKDEYVRANAYRSTQQAELPKDNRVRGMDVSELLELVQEMREASLFPLSAALETMIQKKRKSGEPISVVDVQNIFLDTQKYTHNKEGLFSPGAFFSSNSFAGHQRYLHNGRLYYECDGAHELSEVFFNRYFENDSDIEISGAYSFVTKQDPPDAMMMMAVLLTSPSHVRTQIRIKSSNERIILDTTPLSDEADPADFIVPMIPPYKEGLSIPTPPALPERPVYKPVRSGPKKQPKKSGNSKSGLSANSKPRLSIRAIRIQKARAVMQENQAFKELVDMSKFVFDSASYAPLRAFRLSSLILNYASGVMSEAECLNLIAGLYPGVVVDAAEGQVTSKDLQNFLNKVIATEQAALENISKLSLKPGYLDHLKAQSARKQVMLNAASDADLKQAVLGLLSALNGAVEYHEQN